MHKYILHYHNTRNGSQTRSRSGNATLDATYYVYFTWHIQRNNLLIMREVWTEHRFTYNQVYIELFYLTHTVSRNC